MATNLESELKAAGTANVIVVMKTTATRGRGASASATKVDPAELKKHFVPTDDTGLGAVLEAMKTSKTMAMSARSGNAKTHRRPPAMRVFHNLGIVYGTVDQKGYDGLKADKTRVLKVLSAPEISLIRPVSSQASAAATPGRTWGITRLNAPALWDRGFTGSGILVGHLDTGVDGKHPVLKSALAAFAEFDQLGTRIDHDVSDAFDSDEHGTHTAGTIAGRKVGTTEVGVAPDATLASAVVIEGGEVIARILGGMDWAIEMNVRILSMSLGLRGFVNDFLPVTQIIRDRGILPVFAVGNEGPGTSRSPGNYAEALSVGASDQNNLVADFSSSRRFLRTDDPRVPDLVGPGVDTFSALPGGGFGIMSGTSMATPHIAGLAALLFSAHPEKTAEEIETAIFKSCKRPTGVPASRANRGIPDAVRALAALD